MLTALQHLTVTLNDHEVQGLSGFEAPDNIQLATIRRGSTGDVAAFSAPQRGGPVSITLEPDSPSLPFEYEGNEPKGARYDHNEEY